MLALLPDLISAVALAGGAGPLDSATLTSDHQGSTASPSMPRPTLFTHAYLSLTVGTTLRLHAVSPVHFPARLFCTSHVGARPPLTHHHPPWHVHCFTSHSRSLTLSIALNQPCKKCVAARAAGRHAAARRSAAPKRFERRRSSTHRSLPDHSNASPPASGSRGGERRRKLRCQSPCVFFLLPFMIAVIGTLMVGMLRVECCLWPPLPPPPP